jgi:hypothetical protein
METPANDETTASAHFPYGPRQAAALSAASNLAFSESLPAAARVNAHCLAQATQGASPDGDVPPVPDAEGATWRP